MDKKVSPQLTVVKIGGHVIDDETALGEFLQSFAAIPGLKVLAHGGGKVATTMAKQLGIPQTMIEGRRVTDAETLKVITKVYRELNASIVERLRILGVSAVGVAGTDHRVIRSRKRPTIPIDYGFVGDIEQVGLDSFSQWIDQGLIPVVAPLTQDASGQVLNTNADSIATSVAIELSKKFRVSLFYAFEKKGVLLDVSDENSLIPELNFKLYQKLRAEHKIFEGMIPKLDNSFLSIQSGVAEVIIGRVGKTGTRIIYE